MSDSPKPIASRAMSHLAVAALAAAAVLSWQSWSNRRPPAPVAGAITTAPGQPGAATLSNTATLSDNTVLSDRTADTTPLSPRHAPTVAALAADGVAAGASAERARAPVHITMAPQALRVWHNTRVRLQAQPGPETAFERFVWHFEDGSDPVEGVSVEHVFPESVTDRHITLEAHRSAGPALVITKRLPIERLAVVPVDGDAPLVRPVPAVRGLRIALLGAGAVPPSAAVIARLLALKVAAIVVFGSAPAAGGAAQALIRLHSSVPLLHVDTTLANIEVALPDAALERAPLTVVHDPLGRVTAVPGGQVWVLSHMALVVHDSRPVASTEAAMLGLQRALRVASAYAAVALISARPLSPLTDGEQVADRAFRMYEHALRSNVRVAISASSGVAYDGRYGGLGVVAVGQLAPVGCARLAGSDDCQAGTVTLLDLRKQGRSRALHLRQPSLTAWLDASVLPPAVGKYRR